MKVVLLAGGFGTRISEESETRPKPMVEIGNMPILWHIMKSFAHFGHNEFIICAGYKQSYIKEWFANYFLRESDVTFDYRNGMQMEVHTTSAEPWRVTVADTGLNTMTGGRIKRIRPYVKDETFLMTYGDAVCDVDINDLIRFHQENKKTVTLTAVVQKQQKGVLDIDQMGAVKKFREKQLSDGAVINAGYMVLEPEIFNYLEDDSTVFETTPMERLAAEGQLMSYRHDGFWQCMDSLREKNLLEDYWKSGAAPWKTW